MFSIINEYHVQLLINGRSIVNADLFPQFSSGSYSNGLPVWLQNGLLQFFFVLKYRKFQ